MTNEQIIQKNKSVLMIIIKNKTSFKEILSIIFILAGAILFSSSIVFDDVGNFIIGMGSGGILIVIGYWFAVND